MKEVRGERVAVRARLLPDPSLWCWEFVDETDGSVLDSSWSRDWEAFESPDEAVRAALRVQHEGQSAA